MTDFERYVLEEHVEDFNDGIISRRELLRRVTLITGSLAMTMTMLTVLGCGDQPASSGAVASPTSQPTGTPRPFATPPAQKTSDGITVRPDDPRIRVLTAAPKGPDGAPLIAYQAVPSGISNPPVVLVVHENSGLKEHIKDVCRRLATAGFGAIAIDLLSRSGGIAQLPDTAAYAAALAKRPPAEMVADLQAALEQAAAGSSRRGITGFCFGGGLVWQTLAARTALKAAVPFYGPAPADPTQVASTGAAVLALYAQLDTRITSTAPVMEEQLKKTGHPYQVTIFPGVNHAFHNDTGDRYDPGQAEAAWVATIDWFRKYL